MGDWLLTSANGRVRFVIGDVAHREGFQASGGNLLDISLDGRDDVFDGMSTWFEREFPRQGSYATVEVEGTALVARGFDSGDARIAVTTRWEVVPPPEGVTASLRVSTIVTAPSARTNFDLGDIIGWGGLRHFGPGPGFALNGQDPELPWLGAQGADHALLLVGDGPMTGPHGASWSDPVYRAPDLPANTDVIYVRTLHVGETLAEMLGATGAPRRVTVTSRETGTGALIPHSDLVVEKAGEPWAVGRTGPDGTVEVALPADTVSIRLDRRGRLAAAPVTVGPKASEVVAEASPEGRLAAVVRGLDGEPVAARLTFFGREGTATPNLGPAKHAIGGNRANLAGPTTFAIPPGSYRVVATRGPTWSRAEATVEVPEGRTELTMRLTPLLPLEGWAQCDLHQHAAYSSDSAIPPVDGVIASAAEGLDCIATTEHDAVADWTAHITEANLPDPIVWLSGIEVTHRAEGHYNVYPYGPALGPIDHRDLNPFDITARIRSLAPDAVLQVNHPRYGPIGVFNRLDDAPSIARLDHDVVELLNGKSLDGAEEVLSDVAMLLGRGVRTGVIGASDSHHLVGQERGSARTYVWLGGAGEPSADTPLDPVAVIARELRGPKRAVATNGPLVALRGIAGEVVAEVTGVEWLGPLTVSLYAGPAHGNEGGLGDPVGRATTGEAQDGLLQTRAAVKATPGHWYIAVVRGERSLEPWLDVTPWAATVLVTGQ